MKHHNLNHQHFLHLCFCESFLALNDSGMHFDHVTGEIPKIFWEYVSEAMKGSDNDDDIALQVVFADKNKHCVKIKAIHKNLTSQHPAKKDFNLLWKAGEEIQRKRTSRGEHDSDPFDFVEFAMTYVGKQGLSMLECYCFLNDLKAACFAQEMHDVLKGNRQHREL